MCLRLLWQAPSCIPQVVGFGGNPQAERDMKSKVSMAGMSLGRPFESMRCWRLSDEIARLLFHTQAPFFERMCPQASGDPLAGAGVCPRPHGPKSLFGEFGVRRISDSPPDAARARGSPSAWVVQAEPRQSSS